MSRRSLCLLLPCPLLVLAVAAGCGTESKGPAPAPPAVVTVSEPLERDVTDYQDFTGRTDAVERVDVRARVGGYLKGIYFKDGAEVKKDELLFLVDPSTYEAELARSQAQVKVAEAQLAYSEAVYRRDLSLRGTGGVSLEQLEQSRRSRDVAEANLRAARDDAARNQLNVDFTRVTAPISGRASRAQITVGNLVEASQAASTLLTTIVSLDPMYAYFDVDERTMLRVQKLIREGKVKSARPTRLDREHEVAALLGLAGLRGGNFAYVLQPFLIQQARYPVFLGLSTEDGHPHEGYIDFVNNQIDASTGTIRVRGVFSNEDRYLTPGLFVRVRIPIGDPHKALLVTERALGTDQGQKFLYVVNDKNEVVYRPVTLGALHNGLREIEQGLKAGERVIVNGLQRVRPGVTVEPKQVDMASLVAPAKAGEKPADNQ